MSFRAGDTQPRNLSLSPVLEVLDVKLPELVKAYNTAHPLAGLELRGRSILRLPASLVVSFFEKVFLRIDSKVQGALCTEALLWCGRDVHTLARLTCFAPMPAQSCVSATPSTSSSSSAASARASCCASVCRRP